MKKPVFDDAWSEEVKAVYRHDLQEIWDTCLQPHIWSQYQNQLKLYRQIVCARASGDRLRILDVGCAQATLALLLAEEGHTVVAVDLRQEFLDYAKRRYTHGEISFHRANALEFETDERFDVVFANQLVEHLVYPLQLLIRLRTFLADAGVLVATTPNWRYAANRLPSFSELGDVAQYAERQFTADGDGHFFAYKEGELLALFLDAGLRNVRAQFFETPFVSGHMKVRYAHGVAPPALLKALDRVTLATPFLGRWLAHQLMVTGSLA